VKHRVVLAGALAGVLVTAACGAGGSSSAGTGSTTSTTATTTAAATADPAEWTNTFCEGIGPTAEAVVDLYAGQFAEGGTDPTTVKTLLLDHSAKAGKSLTDAGERLEALGAPFPEARTLHGEVVAFFTDSGKELTEVNSELAKLDPADPEFTAKLERLGSASADPSELQEQIKKLQDVAQLDEAFKQAPRCVEMVEKLKSLGG
jgi:hypothetical protein